MSDSTYVRVKENWYYICVLVDLYYRGIIGHITRPNKDTTLAQQNFSSISYIFHGLEMIQSPPK